MPITLLTFSHKNDSVSAEDRAMRAHLQRQTQDRLVPLLLLSRPRKVSLDLQFHASALPALLSTWSQWISSHQQGLYTDCLSFNSHRRIIILHPSLKISPLIFLRIQNLGVRVKFPRKAKKEFPNGNNFPLFLFRRNHRRRICLLISNFLCSCMTVTSLDAQPIISHALGRVPVTQTEPSVVLSWLHNLPFLTLC